MMPFPPRDPNAPPRPKAEWGPNKTRRYAVWYTSRKTGGANEDSWQVGEFSGQHVKGVHNAVTRHLREKLGKPELKASDVLIMEAHVIPKFVTFEKFMAEMFGTDEEE